MLQKIITYIQTIAPGWKTAIVSAIVAALGAAQGLDWITLVNTPTKAGWTAAGLAVLYAGLRAISITSIFKSTSPAPMPLKEGH
jgi:hypothetical protein